MDNSKTKPTGFYVGEKPKAPQNDAPANAGAKIEVQQTNQPSTPAPRPYACK